MAKRSGGRIFLIILGFLVLAAGLALITLGLIYIIPDIKEIFKAIPSDVYYLAGGIAGFLLSVTILILGFRRTISRKKTTTTVFEKRQDPNVWNTANDTVIYSTPVSSHNTAAPSTIKPKVKETTIGQAVICEKCGTENVYGEYYCAGCKSALKKICKLCGHDNPSGTDVCEGCGKVM